MANRTVSVTLPGDLLPEIDEAARRQGRSRSSLVREALIVYLSGRRNRTIPLEDAEPDEVEAINRGREEFARGEFIRLVDLQHELGLPTK
jgi:metal-responsive CopG/Arc/MetJ family transcriptional regulator